MSRGGGERLATDAKPRPMLVAGVMSGTSADGVDAVVCRIRQRDEFPAIRVLGHVQTPYPADLREAVLRAMNARSIAVAELSRLDWRLGGFYADCVQQAAADISARVQLVGCHGQTVYHQASAAAYLGSAVRCTWQIGEAAVIAERLRCPVVSDFRPADLAAGGEGAPLVPMLDWAMLRSQRVARVLQNLGGIGNLTAMPAKAALGEVLAFDTGPGNMVIDGCMRRLFGRQYDADGETARLGSAVQSVVKSLLRKPYFLAAPPKSCGREQFGDGFVERLIRRCRSRGASDADIVATATALTVGSIVDAYERFVQPAVRAGRVEVVLSGGGTRNGTLVAGLRSSLGERGATLRSIDDLGVSAEAKEATAFALMAYLTWHGVPGNVVGATGAKRAVVLGKICYA